MNTAANTATVAAIVSDRTKHQRELRAYRHGTKIGTITLRRFNFENATEH